jgi:aspartyl/asparaginyl beta-hydroxylase (cupin superfamily)
MHSPNKLCSFENNYFHINENKRLAEELKMYFCDPKTDYLWKLITNRQKMAHALRHTEMVVLRRLVGDFSNIKSTNQFNQEMAVADTEVLTRTTLFQETVAWLEQSFIGAGAAKVEWGRIFFSKHFANSDIDIHTDEGQYFDYYDRFHFVIDQTDNENIFHIRDEDVKLLQGNLYWVNNHVPHWLKNTSNKDRINLIVDARIL